MTEETQSKTLHLRDVMVVTPSLHWHYSGATATIVALGRLMRAKLRLACVGPLLPPDLPKTPLWRLVLEGWSRPPQGEFRVWHARRNNDMIVGLLLKHVLRQKWKLIFTWAGQRRRKKSSLWMQQKMDAVIVTSEGADPYINVPYQVIHHGVDLGHFKPLPDRDEEWRRSGLPGKFGLGAFGRLRALKGTDLLVEAALRLFPSYPDATLLIIGRTTAPYAQFVAGLKARVAAAGLAERIIFMDEVSRDRIAYYFGLVSLYVAPMRYEGFGLTPLEAMACGAAVVATRTGAAAQLVADGETGVVVPPDDLDALTKAIESFLADPGKARSMGAKGHEKALAQHGLEAEAAAIQAVYESVLGFPLAQP